MSGQDILQEPRQAVFRVTENGESMYFSVPESVELLQAAAHLRNYLSGENAGKFTAIFPHGEKITQEQFDAAAAERMENTGCIAGAYELDFDARTFSALNIMDGWKRFRIRDVSTAAYFAMKKGNAAPDERWRIFLDRLEERTLNQEPEPEYLTGSRRLCAEDISFAEDIIQNDNLLEFYMEVCFDADQMFGTNVGTTENDDWLNIYANYDLEARRVCDTLEMYLQRGNGDEEAFKYRLSAEEQALRVCDQGTEVRHCADTHEDERGIEACLDADIEDVKQTGVRQDMTIAVIELAVMVEEL